MRRRKKAQRGNSTRHHHKTLKLYKLQIPLRTFQLVWIRSRGRDRTTPADDWMRRTSCLVWGRWWEQKWCGELVQMFLHWQFGLRTLNQPVSFLSSLKVEGVVVTVLKPEQLSEPHGARPHPQNLQNIHEHEMIRSQQWRLQVTQDGTNISHVV